MEAVEPGKPLTFLDAHILEGDSLVGILDPAIMENGIPGDAYKPLTGDDKGVCRDLKKHNSQRGQEYLSFTDDPVPKIDNASPDLNAMPENTLRDVENKRDTYQMVLSDQARESLCADLFVGAYFAPKTPKTLEIVPQTRDLLRLRENRLQRRDVVDLAKKRLAYKHNFRHWHLAFEKIMKAGGFDVVLGNPPWERIKLQEQEFFASRYSEIAAARNKAARDRLIRQLNHEEAPPFEKALFREFETAKHDAEAASQYARTGGRFPLTGIGDLNTYAVFAETFLQLLNPQGRAGMIVPTGIATDDSTKKFFGHIVSEKRLVSLFDFENREKIFPGIHSRIKFSLLTLSGEANPVPAAEFAFFLHQPEQLKEAERRFTLSAEDFSLFNPNTRTCPIFRTRRDMEIACKMYRRAGVFWREGNDSQPEDNPWGVSFQRMFDMSNDSGLFRTRTEMEDDGWMLDGSVFVKEDERYLPLYEAKLFHQYDHRFATFDNVSDSDIKKGNARLMTAKEKSDPGTVAVPRYWVSEREVAERLDKSEVSTGLFIDRSTDRQIDRSTDRQIDRSTDRQIDRSTDRQIDRSTDRQIDRSTDRQIDRSTDRIRRSCRLGWQLALRDVARATDERTGVISMMPSVAVGHTATILFLGFSPSGTSQTQQIGERRFLPFVVDPQR